MTSTPITLTFQLTAARRRLDRADRSALLVRMFQLTAARRRLVLYVDILLTMYRVSTHSRPKAAGIDHNSITFHYSGVSTHSRPKAAGVPCCNKP